MVSVPLELELLAVVSHLSGVIGNKYWSSARAANTVG